MKYLPLLFATLVATSAFAKNGIPASEVRSGVGVEQKLGAKLPLDVQLRDENGKIVNLASQFNGKPVVITPVYYSCPMICNVVLDQMINRMADMKLTVGKDFNVVTYSFDSKETSPEANAKRDLYLRRYGRAGSGEGWHFFTGDEKNVRALSDALGFRYMWDESQQQYAHAAAIVVATPDGKISHYFQGMEYASRDLRLALVEASEGKIGSPVDRLLLLCYDYDPATGQYGAQAMKIVRLGGAATVMGLAGFIIVMLRRERIEAKKKD